MMHFILDQFPLLSKEGIMACLHPKAFGIQQAGVVENNFK